MGDSLRTNLGSTTANSNGTFSITSSTLREGSYSISATATDPAGNTSSSSESLSITVDTTAPLAPIFLTIGDTKNNSTPTITGNAEAGSTVKLYNGSTLLGSATADSNGAFSITSSTLNDGTYSLTSTATDIGGNISESSEQMRLSLSRSDLISKSTLDKIILTGTAHIDAHGNSLDNTLLGLSLIHI